MRATPGLGPEPTGTTLAEANLLSGILAEIQASALGIALATTRECLPRTDHADPHPRTRLEARDADRPRYGHRHPLRARRQQRPHERGHGTDAHAADDRRERADCLAIVVAAPVVRRRGIEHRPTEDRA